MIDIPGDLVWDLPCVQQASYVEGVHWCGCCPYNCMLIKYDDDDDDDDDVDIQTKCIDYTEK